MEPELLLKDWVFGAAVGCVTLILLWVFYGKSKGNPPLPVQYLRAVSNGQNGSITVRWSTPENISSRISAYEIHYKEENHTELTFRTKIVSQWCSKDTLTRADDGIKPLNTYEIQVRAMSESLNTQWTSTTVFVEWHCRLPDCLKNRRKRRDCEDSYSDFCSSEHAVSFSTTYCLFPECTNERCRTTVSVGGRQLKPMQLVYNYFCTGEHLKEAVTSGFTGLVKLDLACKEYGNIAKQFDTTWSRNKGKVPKIHSVLEIVNPSVQEKFDRYLKNIPWLYRSVEKCYHGTQLKCDLLEYLQPCSSTTCGVCGIAKKGFDPNRVSSKAWQRFGKGFYLAPNSSKSYDYPLAGRDQTGTTLRYRCLLVCDVAPGCKYTLYKNDPSLQRPPSGYHSVYGKAKWLWFKVSSDLNYDELVVFDAAAIRPRYILFCENQ